MMPMAKKMGRTVFGVRMGLVDISTEHDHCIWTRTDCHAFSLCCRKAVSIERHVSTMIEDGGLQETDSLVFCSSASSACRARALLPLMNPSAALHWFVTSWPGTFSKVSGERAH